MKRATGNFLWSAFGKILDAALRFVSVPLVLHHYGKADFGLTALASSINIFLQIADFGMNVGAIKLLTECLKEGDHERTRRVIHSGIFLYTGIGVFNAAVLLVIGIFSTNWFNLDASQTTAFQWMLFFLGCYSASNWVFAIFRQLIMAAGRLGWDERNNLIASLTSFVFALLAVNFKWRIEIFYASTLSVLCIPIALRVKWCIANIPGATIGWKWNAKAFSPALATSGIMLIIALVQSVANNARPFLLANRAGIQSVADYRVIQQIATLIGLLGGSIFNSIYPEISRLVAEKNNDRIRHYAAHGTKLLFLGHLLMCGIVAIFSELILKLYLGSQYAHLWLALTVWSFTVLTGHIAILSSITILSTRPVMLLALSVLSCVISLALTYLLAPTLGVMAAVGGYAAYAFMQISFYYLYISPSQGVIARTRYFRHFLLPLFVSIAVVCTSRLLSGDNIIVRILVSLGCSVFLTCYVAVEFYADKELLRTISFQKFKSPFSRVFAGASD